MARDSLESIGSASLRLGSLSVLILQVLDNKYLKLGNFYRNSPEILANGFAAFAFVHCLLGSSSDKLGAALGVPKRLVSSVNPSAHVGILEDR